MKLIKQLKKHEGYRSKAYKDSVGVWTIGYGRNLQTMSISKAQAENWLIQDAQQAEIDLLRNFNIVQSLSENRQQVLINMTYNLGINGLSEFKKMWSAIEDGDFKTACKEMKNSSWYWQVGSRAVELIERMRVG